jgi:hypothetical protein
MTAKPKPKHLPGHADPDEYARFLEVAREIEASDDPEDFDRAFEKVTVKKPARTPPN